MRRLVILCIAAVFAAACAGPDEKYSVTVTIDGNTPAIVSGKAYLYNKDTRWAFRDTADIVNGRCEFVGRTMTPDFYYVSVEGLDGEIPLFLENVPVTIEGVDTLLSKASVKAGRAHELFMIEEKLKQDYRIDVIMNGYMNPSLGEARRQEIMDSVRTFMDLQGKLQDSLIAAEPESHFSLYYFSRDVYDMSLDSAKMILARFESSPGFRHNERLEEVKAVVDREERLQTGLVAPDFTMYEVTGKQLTFSDVYKKNRITMLDFWASWCGPCRQFNPELVEIYARFHNRGLEIVGVSLDRDTISWETAITRDRLNWYHVSDLKMWHNEVAKLYNVRYIPHNIFVDQEGRIVARRLQEDEIPAFLEEYLK